MPDLVAGLALLEDVGPAGWAGVFFLLIARVHRDHEFVDRSPGPEQEASRPHANRVFADGTKKGNQITTGAKTRRQEILPLSLLIPNEFR